MNSFEKKEMNKLNYFSSGRYNRKLEQSYSYDKKKKELKDGKKDKDNPTK